MFDISRSPYKWYTTSFNTLCRVVLSVFFDTSNNIFYILIGEFEVFVNKKNDINFIHLHEEILCQMQSVSEAIT